jgi:high-affinity K+ transport system ATPase subunit B
MAARRLTRTFAPRMMVLPEHPGAPAGGSPGGSVVQLADQVAAEVIAREAGTSGFLAEVAPEAEFALIREEQARGRMPVMMGDGISGAPVLAQPGAGAGMNTGVTAKAAGSIPVLAPNPRS